VDGSRLTTYENHVAHLYDVCMSANNDMGDDDYLSFMFLVAFLFCKLMKLHIVYIIILKDTEISSYTIVSEFVLPHL